MSATWVAIVVSAAGCYLLKVVGLAVPTRMLAHPVAARVAGLIPVGLLAALVAVQVLADGRALAIDARVAGLAGAVVLLVVRAPFLVVVFGAAAIAAAVRFVG